MRRLVGISGRTAVAIALPLAGAIYLAAEVRQEMIIRHGEALNLIKIHNDSRLGDPVVGNGASVTVTTGTEAQVPKFSSNDEPAREQQAAQIPAPKPQLPVQEEHTRQIIISIPDRRLALLEDGELVKVYPVAVGKNGTPSPAGEFVIINHSVNPIYRHEGKEIGPGKDNPLGTRWMGLSTKGYGIHGTNVQSSVGKIASHGCFRMKKKDVEELYREVQVGDTVSIRSERDELTASLFTRDTKTAQTETQIASAATVNASAGAGADQ